MCSPYREKDRFIGPCFLTFNLLAQLEEIEPLNVLDTILTELRFAGGTQKAYLMPIIGHASKVAFGWAESFISRFKNEIRSLLLGEPTIEVLAKVVDVRLYYYSDVRRHSGLSNQPHRKAPEC